MTEERFKKLSAYFISTVIALVFAHLFWEYSTGGVRIHRLFASADYPGLSNWWGIIILPLLAWNTTKRIKKRLPIQSEETNKKENISGAILIGFFVMFIISIVQSLAFTFGYQDITKYLALGVLLAGLILPIYRSECILGHVLGATFTFGPIIPLIGISVMATISVASNLGIKPLVLKLLSRTKNNNIENP